MELKTKHWFKNNQQLLLWMANTSYGRDLLCIDKNYSKIIQVLPHAIKCELEPGKYLYDFRTHEKWAKVIRTRGKDFQVYAQYYKQPFILFSRSHLLDFNLAATVTNFFPNASGDPSPTTVDGTATRDNGGSETFATIRAGNGTGTTDGSTLDIVALIQSTAILDQYTLLKRAYILFDTSALTSAATITSATCGIVGESIGNDNMGQSAVLCNSNPASNTALANSDYQRTSQFDTDYGAAQIGLASWTTDSTTYNTFTVNATGLTAISKTAVTKYGLGLSGDVANSAPTWALNKTAKATGLSAENTGTSLDPKLAVTYTVPISGSSAMMMGVGTM